MQALRQIGHGRMYRPDQFIQFTDELGNRIYGHSYRSQREDLKHGPGPDKEKLYDYVRSVSTVLPKLEAINKRYGAFFKEHGAVPPSAGKIWVSGSKAAGQTPRVELLKSVALDDVSQLEAAAIWLRDMPDLQERYQKEFMAIYDHEHTPIENIGPGYDYAEFYLAEQYLCNMAYITKYHSSLDVCCGMTVYWNAVAEYLDKHPECKSICMDPPWGTHHINVSLQELEEAIDFGRACNHGVGVSEEYASKVLAGADGTCFLCGRKSEKLAARSLAFYETFRHYDPNEDKSFLDGDRIVKAVCPDCTRRWRKEYRRLCQDDDFYKKFHYVMNGGTFTDEILEHEQYGPEVRGILAGFEQLASDFCRAHAGDDDWPEYRTGVLKTDGFGRELSFRVPTDDEQRAERRRMGRVKRLFYDMKLTARKIKLYAPPKKIRRHKGPDSEPRYAKVEPICWGVRLDALNALNADFAARAYDIPFWVDVCDTHETDPEAFKSSGWERLKAWIEGHPDDIKYLAEAVAGNRALSTEYDQKYRDTVVATREAVTMARSEKALREAYEEMDKACKNMFRTCEIGCYIVTTNQNDRGDTKSFACSIEHACELAGLGPILGSYDGYLFRHNGGPFI